MEMNTDPIRAWRRNKKMTQEEFAKMVGLSQGAVSKIEKGVLLPSVVVMARLLDEMPHRNVLEMIRHYGKGDK